MCVPLVFPVLGLLVATIWISDISLLYFPSYTQFDSAHLIKVVNWNTRVWDISREESFYLEMKKVNADVYLLQEVVKAKNPGLSSRLHLTFPEYSISHDGEFLTLSRFPIIYNTFSSSKGYSRHDVYLNNHLVSFYNVHIRVPIYGDTVEKNNLYDFRLRRDQFEDLSRDLYGNTNSIFLGGDFNSTRNYSPIRLLERQFKLNQPSGVLLFPKTYSTTLPAIRIDYQFTSMKNVFVKYNTFGGTISDHFGIYGEFYDNY